MCHAWMLPRGTKRIWETSEQRLQEPAKTVLLTQDPEGDLPNCATLTGSPAFSMQQALQGVWCFTPVPHNVHVNTTEGKGEF
jgi:hypothetical protein